VVVWTILTMSATLGLVGFVGLFHECWTSARASAVSHGNEPPTQLWRHALHNTDHLLLQKEVDDTDPGGQPGHIPPNLVDVQTE
jgi:hypothetical protein